MQFYGQQLAIGMCTNNSNCDNKKKLCPSLGILAPRLVYIQHHLPTRAKDDGMHLGTVTNNVIILAACADDAAM